MLSPSLEDYLEEIYRLAQNNKTPRVTDIASCLNVSLPSVSNALKRLTKLGYIKYYPYSDIILTDKGKNLGIFLVERNRIIRDFLLIINSKCDLAAEAEAMEHYLSMPTIEAINNLVNFCRNNPKWYKELKEYTNKPDSPLNKIKAKF